jgi:hypothetical protein
MFHTKKTLLNFFYLPIYIFEIYFIKHKHYFLHLSIEKIITLENMFITRCFCFYIGPAS